MRSLNSQILTIQSFTNYHCKKDDWEAELVGISAESVEMTCREQQGWLIETSGTVATQKKGNDLKKLEDPTRGSVEQFGA